ncbi:hypothetical protein F443_03298 [Plasmopara halstedii]|uniref:AMP-dependent synthetase/ligase domain-containing protein n=1 Tax=Plasmopara halstedii TaxID=4781 RepID=A0A0P1B4Y6_PLAHL|nr:hypothetical protein F443_03298 [Plasmopara halstedii]CEG49557.1 hypothetical protein F443_03298 [Plasmopara halstedii]|eukprot:XP_024585926.1 hypothetical protein F443_03298 [Plasmopara halstedii]
MGAGSSAEVPMSQIDFESYTGKRYTVEVPNTRDATHGPAYTVPDNEPISEDDLTLYHNFLIGCNIENGSRPLYGRRTVDPKSGKAGAYEWASYNDVKTRMEHIASGLKTVGHMKRQDMVGVFSKNQLEWCLVGHACDRMSYVLVPLYDTLGPDAVPFIVNHTELRVLFCGKKQFDVVMECVAECPTLELVIQFEPITNEQLQKAKEKNVELRSLHELEVLGQADPKPADPPVPTDVATLCYTSGTTGNPKGVILLHKNFTFVVRQMSNRLPICSSDVHCSYLPLAHVFERGTLAFFQSYGASAGFFQGDLLQLMDDLAELRPTIFVSCLARTFSLKVSGTSCVLQRTPVELRSKPPHTWRDGEVKISDIPELSKNTQTDLQINNDHSMTGAGDLNLYSLPPAFDEIDFYSKWLGKQFVDLAWKTFAGREVSTLSTRQGLDDLFKRFDQRKVQSAIPPLNLPVSTFAEFLENCTAHCKENSYSNTESRLSSIKSGRRRKGDNLRSLIGNENRLDPPHVNVRQTQPPLPPQRQRQISHMMQKVKSKIQPDLDARRKKILRVKKTQSQRIAETLARARLAEYDARRELQGGREQNLRIKKTPISEITTGAAALEIVDDFMKSPLMDKFSQENVPNSTEVKPPTKNGIIQKDPLKEELYGTVALDSSFLGCKCVPKRRLHPESETKSRRRNYNGWLGDFGPLHTKTVRPEWNECEEDAFSPKCSNQATYEWNFNHLPKESHENADKPKLQPKTTETRRYVNVGNDHDQVTRVIDDFDDNLSDHYSVISDPVYQWLKEAV